MCLCITRITADEQSRESITLQNDPNFDPMSALPGLDLITALTWDGDVNNLFQSQKVDSQKVSQFTPLGSQNPSSGRGNISIDLPESFHDSYHLPSDLGRNSPAGWKPGYQPEPNLGSMNHEQYNLGGFDIEFDVDGNLIEFDDPAQHPLLGNNDQNAQVFQEQLLDVGEQVQVAQQQGEPGVVIMGEHPLPDAEAFPSRKALAQPVASPTRSSEASSTGLVAAARHKRQTRHRKIAEAMIDIHPQLSRKDMKEWQANYVERMDEMRNRPKVTSAAEAKKNALAFLYGGGVASIGAPAILDINGSVHPLAGDFAGKFFKAHILGREVEEYEEVNPKKRRRRGHSKTSAED